jgi:hypothetical protein
MKGLAVVVVLVALGACGDGRGGLGGSSGSGSSGSSGGSDGPDGGTDAPDGGTQALPRITVVTGQAPALIVYRDEATAEWKPLRTRNACGSWIAQISRKA